MNCKSVLAIVLVIALSDQGSAVWLNSEHALDELMGHPIDGLRRDERTFGFCPAFDEGLRSVVCDLIKLCTDVVGSVYGYPTGATAGDMGQTAFLCPYTPPTLPPPPFLGGLIPVLPTIPPLEFWLNKAANLTIKFEAKLSEPNKTMMAELSVSLNAFIAACIGTKPPSATTLPNSTTTSGTTKTTATTTKPFMGGFMNGFLG